MHLFLQKRCSGAIVLAVAVGIAVSKAPAGLCQPSMLREGSMEAVGKEVGPAATSSEQVVAELKRLQAQIKADAQSLSLKEAITFGLQRNPELLQAFSAIQQFEWQLIAAQRRWYPTLQLQNGSPFIGSSWQTFVNDNYAIPVAQLSQPRKQSLKTRQLVVQPGALASWNVIDPTRQPNINAAASSLQQQKYLFDVSARNLILRIQEAYHGLQSSQQLIDSFQQIYQINKTQLEILEARRSIGMVTVLDVEQTRSQLFAQLNELVLYTRNYIAQAATLAEALALPRGQLAIPSEQAEPQKPWPLPLQDTVSRAVEQREEILASLAAAEAADWAGVTALRSYLPVFSLLATGNLNGWNGYQNVPVSADPGNSYSRNRIWTAAVGVGFNWSIFDGGIQAANAQAARAQARQQTAQAATTELQVIQQVRSSYGQMQTARVAVNSAREAYRSAQLAQEAARARFEVGVGDITSVVQTIQQLSQAAQQQAQAVLSYNNAVSQLYRYSATWPGETEQAVEQRIETMRTNPQPVNVTAGGDGR